MPPAGNSDASTTRALLFAGLVGLAFLVSWFGQETPSHPAAGRRHHGPPRGGPHRRGPGGPEDDDEGGKEWRGPPRHGKKHFGRPSDNDEPDAAQPQIPLDQLTGDAAQMAPSPIGDELLRVAREQYGVYIHPSIAIMKHPIKGNTIVSRSAIKKGNTIIAVPRELCLAKSESTKRMMQTEIERRGLLEPWVSETGQKTAEGGGGNDEADVASDLRRPKLLDFDLYLQFAVNASAQTPIPTLMPYSTAKACMSKLGLKWYRQTARYLGSQSERAVAGEGRKKKKSGGDDENDDDDDEEEDEEAAWASQSSSSRSEVGPLNIGDAIFRLRSFTSVGLAPIVDLFSADSKGGRQVSCFPHQGDFRRAAPVAEAGSNNKLARNGHHFNSKEDDARAEDNNVQGQPRPQQQKQTQYSRSNMIAFTVRNIKAGEELFIDYGARQMKTQLYNYGFMDPLSAVVVPDVYVDTAAFSRRAKKICLSKYQGKAFAISVQSLEPLPALRDCIAMDIIFNSREGLPAQLSEVADSDKPARPGPTNRGKGLPLHQRYQNRYLLWANRRRRALKASSSAASNVSVLDTLPRPLRRADTRWIELTAAAYETLATAIVDKAIPSLPASASSSSSSSDNGDAGVLDAALCEAELNSPSLTENERSRNRMSIEIAHKMEQKTFTVLTEAVPHLRAVAKKLRERLSKDEDFVSLFPAKKN